MSLFKRDEPIKQTSYICNEQKPKCKIRCNSKGGYCRHTCDPRYALNGPCEDPENHPERFEIFDIKEIDDVRPHKIIYVETIKK